MVLKKTINKSDGDTFMLKGKTYRVNDLIAKTQHFDVKQIDMESIRHFYHKASWFGEDYVVTMKDYEEHLKRILNADTRFPIIMFKDEAIMDGWHRFFKLIIDGRNKVNAIVLNEDDLKLLIEVK